MAPGTARQASRTAEPGQGACEHGGVTTGRPWRTLHVGTSEAIVVPMGDYLRFRAIERHASAGEIEEAEIEAAAQARERRVAAGRPGARSHDDVMSELLAPSGGWTPPSRT